MQYTTLYTNDNGTAKVQMDFGGKIVEQDFACDNLDENVKAGMAVIREELKRNQTTTVDVTVGEAVNVLVKDLPTIPPEDFEPEQPVEAPVEAQ